jgi:peptidoglycan hydrolase-like protein with peptidoglycan-binding domain
MMPMRPTRRVGTAVGAMAVAVATVLSLNTATAVAATSWNDANRNGQIDKPDTGEAVRCAQRAVIYDGRSVGSSGADGQFGTNTRAGVISYQGAHTDTSGRPLDANGQVGPLTGGAMASEVRQIRISAQQHGDPDTAAEMTRWINDCVNKYYTNSNQSIYH